jgi:hypothetical protein
MTRLNVFYDSDVVSSGCATTKGYHSAARSLLVIAAAGLVQGVVSEQVVQEVKKVLSTKLARHLPAATQVFRELVEGFFKVVPDPHQTKFNLSQAKLQTQMMLQSLRRQFFQVAKFWSLSTRSTTQKRQKFWSFVPKPFWS